ncbi:MAG: class I SAM-dependent methyltransferase [Desulfobacteraceae bacterium]|nr:class I SAM-dependent methyltransferase [Desulfobacteraceae bacterium]
MSVNFYNENANNFAESTVNVDMNLIYSVFLPYLTPGSHILDAGCGSGRDIKFFLEKGFKVTAIDASFELAKIANKLTGIDVHVCSFEEFQTEIIFDAVWACASLLHVPSGDINLSFKNLSGCLRKNGYFYCSFKYGNDEITRNGRHFTNATEEKLDLFIENTGLYSEKIWVSADARPERKDEKWLNAILVKK